MSGPPDRARAGRSLVIVERGSDGTLFVVSDDGRGGSVHEEFHEPEAAARYVRSVLEAWRESRS